MKLTMTHLSETELLDAVEGRLEPDREPHAETCVECRRKAEELRDALASAAAVPVPDPSPLFWDHFSARVRDEIAATTPSRWGLWTFGPHPLAIPAVAALLLVLGAAAGIAWLTSSPSNAPAGTTEVARTSPDRTLPDAADVLPDADDADGDEAWAAVRAVADEVVWDDVNDAGITVRPGSAERAVQTLTAAERRELAALIAEELKRAGA